MAVVAGLLFLAFVYFAVGQAAVLRNGAQTAADAAALGAVEEARSQLREGWLEVLDDPTQWQRFVRGEDYTVGRACARAAVLASLNDAESEDCVPLEFGFTVTVRSEGTVGESIVPGTEEEQATATASAVIEPLCRFDPPEPSSDPSTEPPSDPEPTSTPSEEPEEAEPEPISGLVCEGTPLEIDPEDPVLPDADDLFHVRLTGDDE
ncbi:pilus assembly protein TadG-related protein [Streptomyces sp. G2]|uniref:Putative Flp pilus-assembly TadG-like N-terminal domain-containing protein n=1 Tax=Streptomyces hydrogenans TaxID=1873719 RepID=A0ABQ3P2G2_9ACTN|nr:pilus assembly protein TadG-related protein [Streptomyces sp. G2]GHG25586.1 hypothetical protein GCM10018784_43750 [Streptomyces hydrogenans]GHI19215.1 hypothetical protein Shyd_05860 [Streptomyces hydrogenans]